MLVLSRKTGEKVHIGDDIIVTVLSAKGDKIRIGIDAPREVPIARMEIWHPVAKRFHRDGDKPMVTTQTSETKISSTPYAEILSSTDLSTSARV